jgi:hypothetical protein
MVYQTDSVMEMHRPLRRDTVQIASLGEEFAADGIGRYNDFSTLIDAKEVLQPSCMVAVAVRDKYIVNSTEVDAHILGIADKDITGSSIKQNAMLLCLKKNR